MRRRISAVGIAAAALMLISSLGSTAFAAGGTGGTLEGTYWILQRYVKDGAMTDVPAGVEANATFADGRVSGKSGCNGFGGEYKVDGSSLTFGPLLSTMMACGSPQDDVEGAYQAALGKVATYTATADALTMYDASGAEILVFAAGQPTAIDEVAWALTGYNNGKQAVVSVLADTYPSAIFGSDGKVSGNATCNQFNGGYTATDGTIKIGPLATTRMACPTTEQQDQETAYLAALEAATKYTIQGSTLELRDASGALQAQFTALRATPYTTDTGSSTGTTEATVPPTSTAPDADNGGVPTGTIALLAVAGLALLGALVIVPLRSARNR